MGQAKSRGDRESRITQAQEHARSLRPASIECVHCKNTIKDLVDMEPPRSSRLTGAYCAVCLNCGLVNYELLGPDEHRREAYRRLALDKLERYKSEPQSPIVCETCATSLVDVKELPTEGLVGMRSARAAHCNSCDKPTYELVGEEKAVRIVRERLIAAGFMQ